MNYPTFLARIETMNSFSPIDDNGPKYNIDDALLAAIEGKRLTGYTAEVSQELQQRHGKGHGGIRVPLSAVVQRATGASALVAGALPLVDFDMDGRTMDVDGGVFGELQAAKLGVRMVSTVEETFKMPIVDQRPTGVILDVDEAITDQGGSNFSTVDIKPIVAASILDVENSLDFARNPNARQLVAQHIVDAVRGVMDGAIMNGYTTGTGQTWAGLSAAATNSALAFSVASTMTQWQAVPQVLRDYLNSADLSSTTWAWNPRVSAMLMSAPPFAGATTAMAMSSGIDRFAGAPVTEIQLPVSAIPDTEIFYGDFSQITVAMFNSASVELIANPYETNVFSRGATKLRLITSFGVGVADPKRIIKANVAL